MKRILVLIVVAFAAFSCSRPVQPADFGYRMDSKSVIAFAKEAGYPVSISGHFTDPAAIPKVEAVTGSACIAVSAEVTGSSFTVTVATLEDFTQDQEFTVRFTLGDVVREEKCTASMAYVEVVRDREKEPYWLASGGGELAFAYRSNLKPEQIFADSPKYGGYEDFVVTEDSIIIRNTPRDPRKELEEVIYVSDMVGTTYDVIPVVISEKDPAADIYPSFDTSDVDPVLIPCYENRVCVNYHSRFPVADVQAVSSADVDVRVEYDTPSLLQYQRLYLYLTPSADMGEEETVVLRMKNERGWSEVELKFQKAFLTLETDNVEFDSERQTRNIPVNTNLNESYRMMLVAQSDRHFARGEWLPREQELKITVTGNISDSRSGVVTLRDITGNLSYSVRVSQQEWVNPDAGMTAAQLARRDSLAVRKILYAFHLDEEWENAQKNPSWAGQPNWMDPATPLRDYPGVDVTANGRVRRMFMEHGSVPHDSRVTIPDEIGHLTAMTELSISGYTIVGRVPEAMKNCVKLKSIDMDSLGMEGDLNCQPWWGLASHLTCAGLCYNNFSGEFPDWVADMPLPADESDGHEPVWWLEYNRLSGKVPDCVQKTLRWNTVMLDGSGRTYGQKNMEQQEGYVLTL